MIVPEELETHKEESRPEEQQESASADAKPQEASISEGAVAAQVTEQEQPNTVSEIKTAVTTEDMSIEQSGEDSGNKSEGSSAELEQPKISTAVEDEVPSSLVPPRGWAFPVFLPSPACL